MRRLFAFVLCLLREIGDALAALIRNARSEQPPLAWERTTSAFA